MNLEQYKHPSLIQTMESMIFITCLNNKTWALVDLARVSAKRNFEMLPESIVKECIKRAIKNGWCVKEGKAYRSTL